MSDYINADNGNPKDHDRRPIGNDTCIPDLQRRIKFLQAESDEYQKKWGHFVGVYEAEKKKTAKLENIITECKMFTHDLTRKCYGCESQEDGEDCWDDCSADKARTFRDKLKALEREDK